MTCRLTFVVNVFKRLFMNDWIKEIERLWAENKKLKEAMNMRIKELRSIVDDLKNSKADIEADLKDNEEERYNLEDELDDINTKLGRAEEELSLYQ